MGHCVLHPPLKKKRKGQWLALSHMAGEGQGRLGTPPGKAGDCSWCCPSSSWARCNLLLPGPGGVPALSLEVEVTTPGSTSPSDTVLGTVGYKVSLGKIHALRSLAQSISKHAVEHIFPEASVIPAKW